MSFERGKTLNFTLKSIGEATVSEVKIKYGVDFKIRWMGTATLDSLDIFTTEN